MDNNKETFLERQITHHHNLFDELESSRFNRDQRQDQEDIKDMYKRYV